MVRGRALALAIALLTLVCDAKNGASVRIKPAASCADAKSAAQLIKRARELVARGEHASALRCLAAGSRRYGVGEEYDILVNQIDMQLEMLEYANAVSPALGLAAIRLEDTSEIYAGLEDRKGLTQRALDAFHHGMDENRPYIRLALDELRRGMDGIHHTVDRVVDPPHGVHDLDDLDLLQISNLDASQCSRECHHGGRPNSDCSACVDCDEGWDPAQDCAVCLPCNGDGDADDCSCTCLEGRSGPPNCDVNVCRTSVSSQAIHVFTSNYTSAKRRAQFVIHDGATFTGSSGSTEKPSIGTSYYYSNSFLILRGGSINCSGYEIMKGGNGPALNGSACWEGLLLFSWQLEASWIWLHVLMAKI